MLLLLNYTPGNFYLKPFSLTTLSSQQQLFCAFIHLHPTEMRWRTKAELLVWKQKHKEQSNLSRACTVSVIMEINPRYQSLDSHGLMLKVGNYIRNKMSLLGMSNKLGILIKIYLIWMSSFGAKNMFRPK